MYALKLTEIPEGGPSHLVGKILKLKHLPATVGRGKDATIVIQHRKFSRLHFRLFLSNEQLHIRDLGSTNGTRVNGQLVTNVMPLKLGDKVSVAEVEFEVGYLEPAVEKRATSATAARADSELETLDREHDRQTVAPLLAGSNESDSMNLVVTSTVDESLTTEVEAVSGATAPDEQSANSSSIESLAGVAAIGQRKRSDSAGPIPAIKIRDGRVGNVDPAEFAIQTETDVAAGLVDPAEIDLGDVAVPPKVASPTALGRFFQERNNDVDG